jgi:hypothetical protein
MHQTHDELMSSLEPRFMEQLTHKADRALLAEL